jgi:hypothetical protein
VRETDQALDGRREMMLKLNFNDMR